MAKKNKVVRVSSIKPNMVLCDHAGKSVWCEEAECGHCIPHLPFCEDSICTEPEECMAGFDEVCCKPVETKIKETK